MARPCAPRSPKPSRQQTESIPLGASAARLANSIFAIASGVGAIAAVLRQKEYREHLGTAKLALVIILGATGACLAGAKILLTTVLAGVMAAMSARVSHIGCAVRPRASSSARHRSGAPLSGGSPLDSAHALRY